MWSCCWPLYLHHRSWRHRWCLIASYTSTGLSCVDDPCLLDSWLFFYFFGTPTQLLCARSLFFHLIKNLQKKSPVCDEDRNQFMNNLAPLARFYVLDGDECYQRVKISQESHTKTPKKMSTIFHAEKKRPICWLLTDFFLIFFGCKLSGL